MNLDQESKHFLACVECSDVVMGTLVTSNSGSKPQLKVTYCGKHAVTNSLRSSSPFLGPGVGLSINRRMIETWYVYRALVKYVGGDIEVGDNLENSSTIRLVNKDDFIHPKNVTYELTTIKIHPDNPEDAFMETWPNLVTGFF